MCMAQNQAKKIAEINDTFRRNGSIVIITTAVQQLTYAQKSELCRLVSEYDTFNEDNDPYGEHDFGALMYGGRKYFWKIDYYDNRMKRHSDNPANVKCTKRVLTVMLAEEY